MTSPDRTISIPVSAATHVAIGSILGLLAIAAFWVHAQLPHGSAYKGTAIGIGVVGSFIAVNYWLWCDLQRGRVERRELGQAVEDARAELRTAKAEVLAKIDGLAAHVSEIDAVVAKNQGSIKELTDAVDGLAVTLGKVAKELKVLRECYLQEGGIPPEEGPPETW